MPSFISLHPIVKLSSSFSFIFPAPSPISNSIVPHFLATPALMHRMLESGPLKPWVFQFEHLFSLLASPTQKSTALIPNDRICSNNKQVMKENKWIKRTRSVFHQLKQLQKEMNVNDYSNGRSRELPLSQQIQRFFPHPECPYRLCFFFLFHPNNHDISITGYPS